MLWYVSQNGNKSLLYVLVTVVVDQLIEQASLSAADWTKMIAPHLRYQSLFAVLHVGLDQRVPFRRVRRFSDGFITVGLHRAASWSNSFIKYDLRRKSTQHQAFIQLPSTMLSLGGTMPRKANVGAGECL
jgi:hypothetical protein